MKTTLRLEMATDPRWASLAGKSLEFILSDHAWCEQKAASSGISLISKFSEYEDVVDAVSPVVAEEWGHFRKVLKELEQRNMKLGKQRKDLYVNKLRDFVKNSGNKQEQLVENLLLMAMIEARSCERFKMLWQELEDEHLKKFYYDFMVSEAGHYKMFIDLAKKYASPEHVEMRWSEWIRFEAEMIQNLELRPDRMH